MSLPPQPTPAPLLDNPALTEVLGCTLPMLVDLQGGLLSVKDASSGRYGHVSPGMAALMGRPASQICGFTDADLLDAALAGPLRAAEQTAKAQGAPLVSEHEFELAGQRHTFQVLRSLSRVDDQGRQWLVAVWLDRAPERYRDQQLRSALEQIEQQQLANDRLRRELTDQALRDPASGLHRRGHFEDQLRREVDLSTREHREFSIVFVEIDVAPPKVLAMGNAGQQAVFEAMGRLLRGGTRAMDASCRYDERRFAVLLSGVGLATAHARMEGLRRKCASQIVVHDGAELGFTVSMGVASFPHTASSQEGIIEACEMALAEAHRRGGNHVTLAAIRFDAPPAQPLNKP